MVAFDYTLKDPMGLHARPAGLLVREIKKFHSTVTLVFQDKQIDALRMMAVMRLGTKAGDTLSFICTGEDENAAACALQAFLEKNV